MSIDKKEQDVGGYNLTNATTALILLKEWLSISESQICSTEVLGEHLPKVNNLLETSMNSLSTHFGNVANSGSEISKEINHISLEMEGIEVDGKKLAIDEYIGSIKNMVQDEKTKAELDKLLSAIDAREKAIMAEIGIVKEVLQKNTAEISEIVVGMQFQDRVSQNILITINIMKTISDFLDKEISRSIPNVSKEDRKKLLNKDFSKELLQKFRLGELQHSFVDHLVKHGYIANASDIGFSIKDHNKDAVDDVELF